MPVHPRSQIAPLRVSFASTLLALAGLAAGVSPALAWQTAGNASPTSEPVPPPSVPPETYAGRVVAELVLEAPAGGTPLQAAAQQTARNNIRSYAGGPVSIETIDADLRRLNRVGLFSRVESRAELLESGQVRLIFELQERAIIQDVQVTGNDKINDRQLAEQVDLLVGVPVDRFQVDRAARRIERLYREKGYFLARVSIDEQVLEDEGIVLFRIREGDRLKITSLRFEGAQSVQERLLRRELETRSAGIFHKGALEEDTLDSDIANLITYYRNLGFLDVRAAYSVQPAPNGKEAIVTYLIEEGSRYTLREVKANITTEGNAPPVYSAEELAGLIGIKPGDDYGVQALDDAVTTISEAYGKMGYADVRVSRRDLRDTERPVVDLLLIVDEGTRFTVGQVVVQGNDITKDSVIRREISLLPGQPFDTTAQAETQRRLQQRRLFDGGETRLTIQPPDPAEPTIRDLLVEIKETNTGELNIGGAVSSDSGLVGRLGFAQRNFDITDTPDSFSDFFSGKSFRGGGQTFRIEALPGDLVQTYSASLSDPALYDTDYSGSASVFYRDRDFDEFDERRIGARLGLGRRFGTRWSGSLNLRVESISLGDLEPDRPVDIFAVEDENLLTSIDVSLTRTTLDRIVFPTEGSRTTVGVSQVGVLGGDFNYTKLSGEHTVYLALREDVLGRATTIRLRTQVSWSPQGEDEVPTYERYYLGGQSFRGLDFRTVSPRSVANDTLLPSDDPVGGTFLFFAGTELTHPLFDEVLSGALFIDSGTVINDPGFEDYRVTAGFGLRVLVPALSQVPLAFDFAWPITKEETDETRVFSFTLDVPF